MSLQLPSPSVGPPRPPNRHGIAKALSHMPQLVLSHHVQTKVHGTGLIGRINTSLALTITKSVGTMWAAYLFTVIGITALVGALTNNITLTLVVGGFSSYFLQLVLLPVIMVGQNVQQAASDERAQADHATLTALYELTRAVHDINVKQDEILTELQGRPKV